MKPQHRLAEGRSWSVAVYPACQSKVRPLRWTALCPWLAGYIEIALSFASRNMQSASELRISMKVLTIECF